MKKGFTSKRKFLCVAISLLLIFQAAVANGQNVFVGGTPLSGCVPLYVQFTDSVAPGFLVGSYFWNFGGGYYGYGSDTMGFTFNTPGTHPVSLSVFDTSGVLIDSAVVTVTVLPGPSITYTAQPSNCGACNGSVDLAVSGGTPPYMYAWSSAHTTQDISGVCDSAYNVTVTGTNLCAATAYVVVGYSNALCADADPCTQDTCIGGICQNPLTACNDGNPCTDDSCSNGTCIFTPIICDDADACTDDYCQGGACRNESVVRVHPNKRPATFGNCDGTVDIWTSGGTPPYTNNWSPSVSCPSNCVGLCDGTTYSLTVTDNVGCTNVNTFDGGSQVGIQASATIGCAPFQVNFSDSIRPGVTGVQAWGWSFGDGGWSNDQEPTYVFNTPGVYNVWLAVGDSIWVGSIDSAVLTITVSGPCVEVNTTVTNATCPGICDGQVTVTPLLGVPPFTYLWSNAATTQNLTSICAGTYYVTVTDSLGRQTFDTAVVSAPSISAGSTGALCGGVCNGQVTVSVAGGIPPYSYLWSNAATTPNVTSLCPGNYDVTVTDSIGCVMTDTAIVNTFTQLYLHLQRVPATYGNCDGSINVFPINGVAPYTYNWSPSLPCSSSCVALCDSTNYMLTVTDNAGCVAISPVQGGSNITIVASATSGCAPLQVQFSDSLKPGTSAVHNWGWDLGDGFGWSYDQNPSYVYDTPGVYTVWLYAYDSTYAYGDSATVTITVTAPCITTTTTAVGTTCDGICDGEASVTATGTAPLTYLWSTTATTQTITSLCAGTYLVTVTDSSGNQAFDSVVVSNPGVSISTARVTCHALCDGEATAVVTGGAAPFNYLWSTTATSQTITSLCIGTYAVTVTDDNGCVIGESALVDGDTMSLDIIAVDAGCAAVCNGQAYVLASGGAFPYTFTWSNSATTDYYQINICGGNYYVTVTDDNGCTKYDTVVVGLVNSQVQLNLHDTILCPSDTAVLYPLSGPFVSYLWSNASTNFYIEVSNTGSAWWTLSATDTSGCISTDSAYVEFDNNCVWPGDANYDGIANNQDVLAIGIAYSAIGPMRLNASPVWTDQAAHAWADTFITGVNYKHADCNGDGVVDYQDTTAVSLNYSLTHPKGPRCAVEPPLFVDLPDTLYAGQTVTAPIDLGDANNLVSGVYGVAFTLYYDNEFIDSNSVQVSYDNSWMGTPGVNLLGFAKDFYNNGKIDVTITRIDHVNPPQAAGEIGTVSFTIKDDVSGKRAPTLNMHIDNVTGISADESEVLVCGQADSSSAAIIINGVQNAVPAFLRVYPNPANDRIFIDTDQRIDSATLTDLMGKTVKSIGAVTTKGSIDVKDLPRGTYMLRLEFANSIQNKKILIY